MTNDKGILETQGLTTINSAISDAQHAAAVAVILPAVMSNPNSAAAVAEWNMFVPLAALYRAGNAPKTVFGFPLQFAAWLFGHLDAPGARAYANHLVAYATQAAQNKQNAILAQPAVSLAILDLNQANILAPGQLGLLS
jgi:hypothetical protein